MYLPRLAVAPVFERQAGAGSRSVWRFAARGGGAVVGSRGPGPVSARKQGAGQQQELAHDGEQRDFGGLPRPTKSRYLAAEVGVVPGGDGRHVEQAARATALNEARAGGQLSRRLRVLDRFDQPS